MSVMEHTFVQVLLQQTVMLNSVTRLKRRFPIILGLSQSRENNMVAGFMIEEIRFDCALGYLYWMKLLASQFEIS